MTAMATARSYGLRRQVEAGEPEASLPDRRRKVKGRFVLIPIALLDI